MYLLSLGLLLCNVVRAALGQQRISDAVVYVRIVSQMELIRGVSDEGPWPMGYSYPSMQDCAKKCSECFESPTTQRMIQEKRYYALFSAAQMHHVASKIGPNLRLFPNIKYFSRTMYHSLINYILLGFVRLVYPGDGSIIPVNLKHREQNKKLLTAYANTTVPLQIEGCMTIEAFRNYRVFGIPPGGHVAFYEAFPNGSWLINPNIPAALPNNSLSSIIQRFGAPNPPMIN